MIVTPLGLCFVILLLAHLAHVSKLKLDLPYNGILQVFFIGQLAISILAPETWLFNPGIFDPESTSFYRVLCFCFAAWSVLDAKPKKDLYDCFENIAQFSLLGLIAMLDSNFLAAALGIFFLSGFSNVGVKAWGAKQALLFISIFISLLWIWLDLSRAASMVGIASLLLCLQVLCSASQKPAELSDRGSLWRAFLELLCFWVVVSKVGLLAHLKVDSSLLLVVYIQILILLSIAIQLYFFIKEKSLRGSVLIWLKASVLATAYLIFFPTEYVGKGSQGMWFGAVLLLLVLVKDKNALTTNDFISDKENANLGFIVVFALGLFFSWGLQALRHLNELVELGLKGILLGFSEGLGLSSGSLVLHIVFIANNLLFLSIAVQKLFPPMDSIKITMPQKCAWRNLICFCVVLFLGLVSSNLYN